ncbi:MAG TPA: hypothetical protein PLM52_08245 [Tabrizicola sp.]|nr:hypothetical protein [Tabrizicola sp.]
MTTYNAAFRATVTPPALTPREIAANVAALGYADGWTAADDIALMEGLFRGLSLAAIANSIDQRNGNVEARWKALKRVVGVEHGAVPLDAQTALLAAVRAAA